MSNDPLRIGVVGLGYWGPNLVRVLHDLPDVEVAWLCDSRTDALAKVSRRYPAPAVTSRVVDLLDDPDLEAIVFATPVATHYQLAKAALTAGKHVFVEKPLASSSEEARHLMELAAESSLVLMPGHTFLYSPPVAMIRELIETGELGEIYFISMSRVNLGIHQSDVSVIWDLGPHDFSILRFWLRESPTEISAISRSCVMPQTADVAFINMVFPSGTMAHVELSWLAPSKLRRTALVGSRKMVVYDDTSQEPVRIFDTGVNLPDPQSFGEYHLSYRVGDIVSPRVAGTEPIRLEMLDFLSAIRTGTDPASSAELGTEVVAVIESVERSLLGDSRAVRVSL